jgi:hypothetical protein
LAPERRLWQLKGVVDVALQLGVEPIRIHAVVFVMPSGWQLLDETRPLARSRLSTTIAAHLPFLPFTIMDFCVKMQFHCSAATATLMVGLFRFIAENTELSESILEKY